MRRRGMSCDGGANGFAVTQIFRSARKRAAYSSETDLVALRVSAGRFAVTESDPGPHGAGYVEMHCHGEERSGVAIQLIRARERAAYISVFES